MGIHLKRYVLGSEHLNLCIIFNLSRKSFYVIELLAVLKQQATR